MSNLYFGMALFNFRSASLRRHCGLSGRQLATVYLAPYSWKSQSSEILDKKDLFGVQIFSTSV